MASPEEAEYQGPSTEDIEAALKKTGFLLEHRIAQSLRKNRYKPDVAVADAYPDPETGKSREIDVCAAFYASAKRQPGIEVHVAVELVIECKNSAGPFVLIGDHGQESAFSSDFIDVSFDPFELGFPGKEYSKLVREVGLDHISGLSAYSDFTGRQLLRLNRHSGTWRADNNAIYDSILYPLAKAWKHKMGVTEREKEEYPDENWQYPGVKYVFPVIVTSGSLYTVDATETSSLDIRQAKWAGIKRTFDSKEIKGDLWADVVSVDNWEEYVQSKPITVFSAAENTLAKNLHYYDPEWMQANLGTPSNDEFLEEWLRYYQAKRESRKPVDKSGA